jgi:hypothetical protein
MGREIKIGIRQEEAEPESLWTPYRDGAREDANGLSRFQWGVDDPIFGGSMGLGHVTPPAWRSTRSR